MNRRRGVLWGGATAALLMVVLAVTSNQVLNNRVWSWAWFAAALACAGATVVVGRRLAIMDEPRPAPRLVDENGRPLLIGQVTPRQLGVHTSRFGFDGDSPYVKRDVDEVLARALCEGDHSLVVVQGPRLAGTTSTLAQAAQTYLPGHHVLVFADDPRFSVSQMVAEGGRWAAEGQGAVLWLDDLTAGQLGQFDRALLDSLPTGLWILATVHDKHLKGFRAPEYVRELLEKESTRVAIGTISSKERDRIRGEEVYADLRPVLDGNGVWLMGRLMVALDQIRDALIPGDAEESAGRVALLRVVIDWYRLAMPTLLTRSVLKDLYAGYLREAVGPGHAAPVSAGRFEHVLKWATAGASRERPHLVDREEIGHTAWYAPNPLLAVVADDTGQPGAWPVGEALWTYADRVLKSDQRRDIGYTALDRGAYSYARRLLGHDDTQVEAMALHRVAEWLHKSGEADAARSFYGKVIATGHPDQSLAAMVNLGRLEAEHGNLDEARRWWCDAAETGHANLAPAAMVNLGTLEAEHGNLDEARRWWRDAAETGHANLAPAAMVNLGTLESEHGNLDEARRWWRDAVATGHPDQAPTAMVNLGTLESEHGNLDEARRWWRDAVATGHPDQAPTAMFNLGMLESEHGRKEQARRWWRDAAANGHPDQAPKAMLELGLLESGNGNLGNARRWWGDAAATGHPEQAPTAMGNLGILEYERGNLDEARRWWGDAAATGHPEQAPKTMVLLGVLEAQQGNPDQARRLFDKAVASGHPDHAPAAMVNLGTLEYDLHNVGAARRWLDKALATGHSGHAPAAMVNLGNLEAGLGNVEEARRWLDKAIASGQPEATTRAEQKLRELDRHGEEVRRAEHFGLYGWQAHADPQLIDPGPVQNPKGRRKPPSRPGCRRPR